MTNKRNEYLELIDWRRQVAASWARWRHESERDPAGATARFRADRDRLFRDHPQSPLPTAERACFSGLAYWPYDPAYRMVVRLEPAEADRGPHASPAPEAAGPPTEPPVAELVAAVGNATPARSSSEAGRVDRASFATSIALPSSGSESTVFRRIGRVKLVGPLERHSLSVFWIEGYAGGLFLPFRDATSGEETYAAGRYLLDTIKSADHGGDATRGELVLDFNLAYHPSCAYDVRWSCPLAPTESRLSVPVRAGERLPE